MTGRCGSSKNQSDIHGPHGLVHFAPARRLCALRTESAIQEVTGVIDKMMAYLKKKSEELKSPQTAVTRTTAWRP